MTLVKETKTFNFINAPQPPKPIIGSEDDKLKNRLKLSVITVILLFIFIGSCFFLYNSIFYYYDPLNSCKIGIYEDITRGSKTAIVKALNLLKDTDKQSYKTVCENVDYINEMYCPSLEEMNTVDIEKEGCYIKGTKIIYLKPSGNNTNESIIIRSQLLKRLSSLSKNFWDNVNRY